jgi:hypothetical protein
MEPMPPPDPQVPTGATAIENDDASTSSAETVRVTHTRPGTVPVARPAPTRAPPTPSRFFGQRYDVQLRVTPSDNNAAGALQSAIVPSFDQVKLLDKSWSFIRGSRKMQPSRRSSYLARSLVMFQPLRSTFTGHRNMPMEATCRFASTWAIRNHLRKSVKILTGGCVTINSGGTTKHSKSKRRKHLAGSCTPREQ